MQMHSYGFRWKLSANSKLALTFHPYYKNIVG